MKPKNTNQYTLAEAVVTVVVVVCLIAVLTPFFMSKRERKLRADCLGNIRAMGLSYHLYAQDWRESFPIAGTSGKINQANEHLYLLFPKYMTTTKPFICPSDVACRKRASNFSAFRNTANINSYAYVAGLTEVSGADSPLAGDNLMDVGHANDLSVTQYQDRHACTDNGSNHGAAGSIVMFVDGHAVWNPISKLKIRWVDGNGGTTNIQNPKGL